MVFRNYVGHKYNLHSKINLKEFQNYLKLLKKTGATEIELSGRRLTNLQKQRTKDVTSIIRDEGLSPILYSGPFGVDNFKEYAQRDKENNPLPLMCPSSKYIDNVFLPELNELIINYDGVFFDMPWIMKNGCYCNNCDGDNDKNVREGLKKIVDSIDIKTTVNACAPKIHNEYPSAHIDNLKGIFDEYLTEWNPLKWNQSVSIIKSSIEYAKRVTDKKIYHATTCTNRNREIYPIKTLSNLFRTIIASGATPRLGICFNEKGMRIIQRAFYIAKNEF